MCEAIIHAMGTDDTPLVSSPRRTWAGLTHPGLVRQKNEDRYCGVNGIGLFAVADGMGGGPAGDFAAKLVLDTVRGALEQVSRTWAPRAAASERALCFFRSIVHRAHDDLCCLGQADPAKTGMGTTFAGIWLAGRKAIVAHVGDSRVYRWRAKHLLQLTCDHTATQVLFRNGVIGEADLAGHPYRHILSQVLGGQQDPVVDGCIDVPERGDVYLLTTDGVHDVMGSDEIAEVLLAEPKPDGIVAALIAKANAAGGPDNCTAVAARLDE